MLRVCPWQEDCVVCEFYSKTHEIVQRQEHSRQHQYHTLLRVSNVSEHTLILTAGGLITQITNTQGLTDQTEKTVSRQRDTLTGLIEFS